MSNTTVTITETKEVFQVLTNSDRTEGRGRSYTYILCENEATAIRYAKGNFIQGSDCPIQTTKILLIDGVWYGPKPLVEIPTIKDMEDEKIMLDRRAKQILLDKFKNGEAITQEEREKILAMLAK